MQQSEDFVGRLKKVVIENLEERTLRLAKALIVKGISEPVIKVEDEVKISVSPKLENLVVKVKDCNDEDQKLELIQAFLVSENGDDAMKDQLYGLLNF